MSHPHQYRLLSPFYVLFDMLVTMVWSPDTEGLSHHCTSCSRHVCSLSLSFSVALQPLVAETLGCGVLSLPRTAPPLLVDVSIAPQSPPLAVAAHDQLMNVALNNNTRLP